MCVQIFSLSLLHKSDKACIMTENHVAMCRLRTCTAFTDSIAANMPIFLSIWIICIKDLISTKLAPSEIPQNFM